MNEQEFRALSAAHALDALSATEQAELFAALSEHPEWTRIVEADRETAAALAESVEEVAPPPAARIALFDAIAELPQRDASRVPAAESMVPAADSAVDPADDLSRRRAVRRAGWFALAASLAVLVTLTIGPWTRDALRPVDPVAAALAAIESAPDASTVSAEFGSKGQATLHWSAEQDRAILVAEGLPGLDAAHDFELWIVRGEQPISLGVMRATAKRDVAVIAEGFEAGDAVAVTVEDEGGSPNGLPTTDPILVVSSA